MKRFKNILCVVESGEACRPALERAVALAVNNQANLTFIDVVKHVTADIEMPQGEAIAAELKTAMVSTREKGLEALIDPYLKRIEIKIKVLKGTPFLEIIRDVLRNGRDLVIKTPEPLVWTDQLFGSVDLHLLRKCPCPVWLIKSTSPESCKRILAAVDVDETHPPTELKSRHALNQQILEIACSLALSDFAELHIVHTWRATGESMMSGGFMHTPGQKILAYVEQVRRQHADKLEALMGEVISKLGLVTFDYLKPRTHLVKGWASKEIPLLAKRIEADLVVMGTVCRTGVPGFIMGNTAEMILNQIDCSVLAVKPPGFVTPVNVEG